MHKSKEVKRILISPIGDTDPIRGYHDGACLHIIRYYHPEIVILFYTEDMGKKEEHDHRYTRTIKQLVPDIQIQEIFSHVTDPQNYDRFNPRFPNLAHQIHQQYKNAEVLLNLSSGTPQMKNILAILATEYDWCRGIQVNSPVRGSNRDNAPTADNEDIDELIATNEDNSKSESRCIEPALHVIRYYREKNQILSLIGKYEYKGAYELSVSSKNISSSVKKLLNHADLRSNLMLDNAENVLSRWHGKPLFPYKDAQKTLIEYYYLMKINHVKSKLPELMVKISPFLFEFFLAYISVNTKRDFVKTYCDVKNEKIVFSEDKLRSDYKLWGFFNKLYNNKFRAGDVSFYHLWMYCDYLRKNGGCQDNQLHNDLMKLQVMHKNIINKVRELRNDAAHRIVNINEKTFQHRVGVASIDIVNEFGIMIDLLYGNGIVQQKSIYDHINMWIEEELDKGSQEIEDNRE